MQHRNPPLIAIVGSDGSGKSTVVENISEWISQFGPVAPVHLGKQAGNVGRALSNAPIVGKYLGKTLNKQTKKTNAKHDHNELPSLLPALVISAFTIRRIRRFKRMLALHKAGNIIIADRFPQSEIPKAFDGPGFTDDAKGNWITERLAQREKRVFQRMANYKPDLVIKLHVDLDTAIARKPDHNPESLKRKIDTTPLLTYQGAKVADIDTNQPLDKVLSDVKQAITALMVSRGYSLPNDGSSAADVDVKAPSF